MSQSTDASAEQTVPAAGSSVNGATDFTLVVVSPSNGVDQRMQFPNVAPSTTVKDVKAKIRDRVVSKPQDEFLRLIHHGRLLARDTETMLEVFGPDSVSNFDLSFALMFTYL